jgi:DNA-binding transcriptional LysR family regulator
MDISELNALVKVVQTGSFTKAAELLGTSKAHLSRVISGLEGELKAQLLQRSTRSLSLTEVGRDVFERAVGILASVEDTKRMAAQLHAEPSGTLKLTCGAEFGMLRVNAWINGYLARHPQVTVEVKYTSRLIDLVHEGFDLAIRIGKLQDSRLAARTLGRLEYGLFASPAYLKQNGKPEHPDELERHDLLMLTIGAQYAGWTLVKGSVELRVPPRGRLRVNNSFAVRDAAVAGLGIARLPTLVARKPVEQGLLVPVLPGWHGEPIPVHAVFPSSRYLSPKVRAFIDHVLQCNADEATVTY